jgi:hypothetical protein
LRYDSSEAVGSAAGREGYDDAPGCVGWIAALGPIPAAITVRRWIILATLFLPALNDRVATDDEAGPGRKCAAIPGWYAVDEGSLHLARASKVGAMIGLAGIGRLVRLAPSGLVR